MIEAVFYLFLAGCSEDMTLCEEIASPDFSYASAEDCLMELASAVDTAQSDWPLTEGVCRSSPLDRVAARPDWLPLTEVSSALETVTVASKSSR